MSQKQYLSQKESEHLSESLQKPKMSYFYGLPKIHKTFSRFPPLRPIVSQVQSVTYSISKYVDCFLKFQAQKCKSYIRDTKDFLNKLKTIGKIPSGAFLVTMDVASLYTNIDHSEGAEACFKNLETRQKKSVPSAVIKQLIKLILSNNVFTFGQCIYKQIKGTAMGTPVAPNLQICSWMNLKIIYYVILRKRMVSDHSFGLDTSMISSLFGREGRKR